MHEPCMGLPFLAWTLHGCHLSCMIHAWVSASMHELCMDVPFQAWTLHGWVFNSMHELCLGWVFHSMQVWCMHIFCMRTCTYIYSTCMHMLACGMHIYIYIIKCNMKVSIILTSTNYGNYYAIRFFSYKLGKLAIKSRGCAAVCSVRFTMMHSVTMFWTGTTLKDASDCLQNEQGVYGVQFWILHFLLIILLCQSNAHVSKPTSFLCNFCE